MEWPARGPVEAREGGITSTSQVTPLPANRWPTLRSPRASVLNQVHTHLAELLGGVRLWAKLVEEMLAQTASRGGQGDGLSWEGKVFFRMYTLRTSGPEKLSFSSLFPFYLRTGFSE